MTTDSIKINFKGRMGRQVSIQSHITDLGKHYNVTQTSVMKFSHFDGGGDSNELLKITVTLGTLLVAYLKGKSIEFLFTEGVLSPFANWLEKVQTNLDETIADEIEYKFDDVIIRIGFTKKNHIHSAGVIFNKVAVLKEITLQERIGNLTLVATPVTKSVDDKWTYNLPDENFTLSDYTKFFGLELDNQNRCVISLNDAVIKYESWE